MIEFSKYIREEYGRKKNEICIKIILFIEMQRLVLSSKKNQPFKSLIFGSCGWHISLIDSEMSAVTLALAIIIVILLYLLFKVGSLIN